MVNRIFPELIVSIHSKKLIIAILKFLMTFFACAPCWPTILAIPVLKYNHKTPVKKKWFYQGIPDKTIDVLLSFLLLPMRRGISACVPPRSF
jgi:hypothetical protein